MRKGEKSIRIFAPLLLHSNDPTEKPTRSNAPGSAPEATKDVFESLIHPLLHGFPFHALVSGFTARQADGVARCGRRAIWNWAAWSPLQLGHLLREHGLAAHRVAV